MKLHTIAPALAALGLFALPAAAACPRELSPDELARMLSTADAAFADLDADVFGEALSSVRAGVPCVNKALTAGQVAAYHRAEAYQSFLDRDHAGAVQHFRAMLAAAPGYRLSEEIAPEGHPLRVDFEIAQGLPAEATRSLPAPTSGSLRVDGRLTDQAPRALPFVLQQVDDSGKVMLSTLVEAGSTLELYPAQESPRRGKDPEKAGARRTITMPLVAATLVTGATAAALYGMSNAQVNEFWDPAPPADPDELARLQRQANTTATLSLGLGLVAAGTGTAAVLSFAW